QARTRHFDGVHALAISAVCAPSEELARRLVVATWSILEGAVQRLPTHQVSGKSSGRRSGLGCRATGHHHRVAEFVAGVVPQKTNNASPGGLHCLCRPYLAVVSRT